MVRVDEGKIKEMFDYLHNPTEDLQESDGVLVFGRRDPKVAKSAYHIYMKGLTDYLLFTGGIGKDSGILTDLGLPEAKWQAALAGIIHRVPSEDIYVEPNATNGGDCCRFSIDKILKENLPHNDLILLVHSTSLRRTQAVMDVVDEEKNFQANYQRAGTNYTFNPLNSEDQKEAVAEILRLDRWPAKGWASEQLDLPSELVAYACELDARWASEKK